MPALDQSTYRLDMSKLQDILYSGHVARGKGDKK